MSERIPKKIKLAYAAPGDIRLGFILLPVGYAYNIDIASAKKGDIIRFVDGDDYQVFNVLRLKLKSPITKMLCLIRYGITIDGALMRWRNNAKMEGHGINVVSDEECLFVTYETDPV